MKKIIYLLLVCLYALGVIGGVGYTLWCGAYLIAIGVGVLGWMAWAKAKELFSLLSDGSNNTDS